VTTPERMVSAMARFTPRVSPKSSAFRMRRRTPASLFPRVRIVEPEGHINVSRGGTAWVGPAVQRGFCCDVSTRLNLVWAIAGFLIEPLQVACDVRVVNLFHPILCHDLFHRYRYGF